ncbi:MAG: adenosylcobinamide-GDP ribazoletransferase [Gammaproteobacteria bacterium]|nr:MAG: adenosylcobinamide-GDP ribazoletransferase [Gammaproteobacteria bacterium]
MEAAFEALRGALGRERLRLLAAVQYFTRLRVPGRTGHAQETLEGAIRYLPVVGAFVGAAGAAIYLLVRAVLPAGVAVALSMAATVIITGALHEDGLADAADGLGGGSSRERVLAIMKDPHVGAFGATSLMLALLLKFNLLLAVPPSRLPAMLIAGHALSRLAAVGVLMTLPYVRDEERSRAKPLVTATSGASLVVAVGTGLAPLALVGKPALTGAGCVVAVGLLWRAWLRHRLGGYTGDCLGAAQQLTEIAFYVGADASAFPH